MGLGDFSLDEYKSVLSHDCYKFYHSQETSYGSAISKIEYFPNINQWVMHNDEYGTYPIFFCPFCGQLLKQNFSDNE